MTPELIGLITIAVGTVGNLIGNFINHDRIKTIDVHVNGNWEKHTKLAHEVGYRTGQEDLRRILTSDVLLAAEIASVARTAANAVLVAEQRSVRALDTAQEAARAVQVAAHAIATATAKAASPLEPPP